MADVVRVINGVKYRLSVYYKRVDVRKEKRYGQSCSVNVYVPKLEEGDRRQGLPLVETVDNTFWNAVKRLAPNVVLPWERCPRTHYTLEWHTFVSADKPSAICDEKWARAHLPDDDTLFQLAVRVREEAERQFATAVEAGKQQTDAVRFLTWYHSEVGAKAREVTRYTQRLAALEAELKAEIDQQLAPVLKECKTALDKKLAEGTADFSAAAAELFMALAPKYIAEHRPSSRRSRLPDGHDHYAVLHWVQEQTAKKGE